MAFGGDLCAERLLAAYGQGIFPWYDERVPPMWWSPDPRGLMSLATLHVSRSLHKGARCVVVGRLRSHSWETPEGQRRSAVEVNAEEVGMSLRFAPAAPPAADGAAERPAPAAAPF